MKWDQGMLVGMKTVVVPPKHHVSEATHDWLGLQVEIAEHGVTFSAAEEAGSVAVDS